MNQGTREKLNTISICGQSPCRRTFQSKWTDSILVYLHVNPQTIVAAMFSSCSQISYILRIGWFSKSWQSNCFDFPNYDKSNMFTNIIVYLWELPGKIDLFIRESSWWTICACAKGIVSNRCASASLCEICGPPLGSDLQNMWPPSSTLPILLLPLPGLPRLLF